MKITKMNNLVISKEEQRQVIDAMKHIIETRKEGNRKKMTSTFDMKDYFKSKGMDVSHQNLRTILNVLIAHKLVRYYVDERKYIYFGLTKLCWSHIDREYERQANIAQGKVECSKCGKFFSIRGIKNHERACNAQ